MGTIREHIGYFPSDALYNLARNDTTRPEYKDVAIDILLERGARRLLAQEDIASLVDHGRRRAAAK